MYIYIYIYITSKPNWFESHPSLQGKKHHHGLNLVPGSVEARVCVKHCETWRTLADMLNGWSTWFKLIHSKIHDVASRIILKSIKGSPLLQNSPLNPPSAIYEVAIENAARAIRWSWPLRKDWRTNSLWKSEVPNRVATPYTNWRNLLEFWRTGMMPSAECQLQVLNLNVVVGCCGMLWEQDRQKLIWRVCCLIRKVQVTSRGLPLIMASDSPQTHSHSELPNMPKEWNLSPHEADDEASLIHLEDQHSSRRLVTKHTLQVLGWKLPVFIFLSSVFSRGRMPLANHRSEINPCSLRWPQQQQISKLAVDISVDLARHLHLTSHIQIVQYAMYASLQLPKTNLIKPALVPSMANFC